MTERVAAECWYDPLYFRTRISVFYQREAPHGEIYRVDHLISDEYLANPHYADIALHGAIKDIIDHLRVKFYKGHWTEVEKAILLAVESPATLAPPRPKDTHYKDTATSEFEGVTELDASLWNSEGDDLV